MTENNKKDEFENVFYWARMIGNDKMEIEKISTKNWDEILTMIVEDFFKKTNNNERTNNHSNPYA